MKSPDGRWIVESQLLKNSGPGTDGVSAEVYISPSSDPKDRTLILSITEPADTSGDISMAWKGENTLELGVPGEARIGFQVVRVVGNVDIHTVK